MPEAPVTRRAEGVAARWARWPWAAEAGALAAGGLLVAGYAPLGLFPLALILPAALFLLWERVTPRRAFRLGFLFGLGLFGFGVSWVYVSISRFGNTTPVLAASAALALVLVVALFPALVGYLANRWARGVPVARLVLAYPALWVLAEWARGWLGTGFPWLALGYSQSDALLAGLAPLGGVYLVGLATAVSAGLVALVVRARAPVSRWAGVGALVGLWLLSGLAGQVEWTRPSGAPLRVALVQGNIGQGIKWVPEQHESTLERYRALTAAHWDAELIVWPETAVTAFYHEVQPYLAALEREALDHEAALIVGVPVMDTATGRYYNSVVSLGGDRDFYHKRHLVPFGEYVPLEPLLGRLLDVLRVPMSDFAAGDPGRATLEAAGKRLGMSICYEDAFGREVIDALPEASLLVNVSNDAWFGDSLAPHQHLQIARMRAREAGRAMLRATNTGISALIGPRGEVRARAPQFEPRVLTGTAQPRRGATPYVRAGNAPAVWLAVLAAAAAVGLSRFQEARRR
ncbi:MAG: apolipoprotein N-acyltransferase [Gammaproteobacteria bacterium]|nr:apolipoprotein N-acyltransferase [Gammaproteobacteria bacterium]